MIIEKIFFQIDSVLIYFYRISEIPIVGYLMGTAVLAILSVIFGQLTLSIAYRYNEALFNQNNSNMVKMHNLSIFALLSKDKKAYKACNKEANDAFGKVFFSQIALGISSLWPIPFALSWMQIRFLDVMFELPLKLPIFGGEVGFTFTFLLVYILTYIFFGKIKPFLPYFKNNSAAVVTGSDEKLLSITDVYEGKQAVQAGS